MESLIFLNSENIPLAAHHGNSFESDHVDDYDDYNTPEKLVK